MQQKKEKNEGSFILHRQPQQQQQQPLHPLCSMILKVWCLICYTRYDDDEVFPIQSLSWSSSSFTTIARKKHRHSSATLTSKKNCRESQAKSELIIDSCKISRFIISLTWLSHVIKLSISFGTRAIHNESTWIIYVMPKHGCRYRFISNSSKRAEKIIPRTFSVSNVIIYFLFTCSHYGH